MWIEILQHKQWIERSAFVTPYAGVWIEINVEYFDLYEEIGHSLRGSVDWNIKNDKIPFITLVTPYAGVWIEISGAFELCTIAQSLPTRECGLKSKNRLVI